MSTMERRDIERAAALLADAHQSGSHIDDLPEGLHPADIAEAHAVQDEVVRLIGEEVAGWKVAGTLPDEVMRGAVLASRLQRSPGDFPAGMVPLLGIEGEVAFRFLRDVLGRSRPYSRADLAADVVAVPAIEVVDSRFVSYTGTPVVHRLCDLMSNGGLVVGDPLDDWDHLDYRTIGVAMDVDGQRVMDTTGGHRDGDPLLPALAFVNSLPEGSSVRAGQIVTTGTFTGLRYGQRGEDVQVTFSDLGSVRVHFS
jgi:2-keto-4-pentenoate hydratase